MKSETHHIEAGFIGSGMAVRHELMADTASERNDNITVMGGSVHIGDNYYYVKDSADAYESQKFKELLNSLPSLGFVVKHEAAQDQCMPGTGQWFIDSDPFKRWLSGRERILWCPGIPGAGKTCMASIVIEHLRLLHGENRNFATAYLYFEYSNRDQHSPRALFGDLLAQILRNQPTLSQALLDKYEEFSRSRTILTKDHFLSLLKVVAKSYEKIFIVIDALDECAEKQHKSVITSLRDIGPEISLLITSRYIGTIAELFEHDCKQDISATNQDMANYIRNWIAEDAGLSTMVQKDTGLEQEIVTALVHKAQNMFLLVRLHVESLSGILTKNKVRNALEVLPRELNQTYDAALKRVYEQTNDLKTLGLTVLMWLMKSMRPMSLTELHHAVSVEPEQQQFVEDDLIDNLHMLASTCAGLVVMDPKANTIGLVHYTTQEYLVQRMPELNAQPQAAIAEACLTYLHYEDFDHPAGGDRDDLVERFPFVAYAARYWGWHLAQAGDVEPQVQNQAVSLLEKKERFTDIFILEPSRLDPSDDDPHRSFVNRAKPSGLHIAAHFGLHGAFQTLIERGGSLDCRDDHGNTPLHYAAWTGQGSILQFCQQKSGEIMMQNDSPSGRSVALQCAAANGQAAFVAGLIAAGADPNYNPNRFTGAEIALPAIHEAVIRNHLQVVEQLLELGADVDLHSTKWGTSPFHHACELAQPESMELLLRFGASLEGERGHQALLRLARREYGEPPKQYLEAMALLHESHVDLNRALDHGYRVLDFEISLGHEQMISSLLDIGARPGLTWYVDQPAIRRWAEEPWFAKLQGVCIDFQQIPSSHDELQKVVVVHARNEEGRFTMNHDPRSDWSGMHYIWPETLLLPGGMESLNKELFMQILPYLRIEIPQNFVRVTRIVITTESHDQGYTTFNKHANGTYNVSYTWFDLLFYYHKHPHHPIWQDKVQANLNASWEWRIHKNIWDVEQLANTGSWIRADAIWQLQPGDTVMLFARAFFPGWENHVKSAELRIEGLGREEATT